MCMEDVRIGRESQSIESIVTVAQTSVQMCGGSDKRICLIISRPITGNLTLSMQSPVVSGVGIVLSTGGDPFMLDIQTHGDLCKRAWYGIMDAGTMTHGVYQTILKKE